jgi:peptide/nickel transport system permease protein
MSAVLTLWIALTVIFLLPRMMGGDPAQLFASQTALGSAEYAELLRDQWGLNDSLLIQYLRFFTNLTSGDMGTSYSIYQASVSEIIVKALPWTLLIVVTSTLISFAIAWFMATIAALKKGGVFDRVVVGISFYLRSVPYFFVAMLLLVGFSFYLRWFPISHARSSGLTGSENAFFTVLDIAYHAFLPCLSLIVVGLAGRLVVMRSNILQIFSEDYITLAQAKGLRRGKILSKYALRNALLPSFTGLMLSLGTAVGGAITTELIFSYPGIGLTMYNAILNADYPLIQGCFTVLAISIVLMNFIADLIYPIIDPRVSLA